MEQPAILLEGISHWYQENLPVLQEVSFSVQKGSFVSLLGPNGSGKTTIFRILSTLLKPSLGSASVNGYSTTKQAHLARRSLGVIFQSPALDGRLSVKENLKTHGMLHGLSDTDIKARIDEIGEGFEVVHRLSSRADTLSGGLLRQADLLRGLLHQPKILMLDEPTSGLDPAIRRTFWALLESIQKTENLTILLTTHLLNEADASDEVIILNRGTVVANGHPSELKNAMGEKSLWIDTNQPDILAGKIYETFHIKGEIAGKSLRLSGPLVFENINSIYEKAGSLIDSMTIRKPDLDDVFLKHTGTRLGSTDAPLNDQ